MMNVILKNLTFHLIMVLLVVVVCEMSLRVFFAFKVGPNVLLYGTEFFNPEVSSKLKMGKWATGVTDKNAVKFHDNLLSNYSKYFPNQIRYDVDTLGERFKVTINNRGFRGKEFSEEKKSGITRVVTLGASSTFGYKDRDHETYPYYLEEILNQKCQGKRRFEVINLGIPHMHSATIYSLFLAEALPLDPDIVTFYEGINDTIQSPKGSIRDQTKGVPLLQSLWSILHDHSLLTAFLESVRRSMRAKLSTQDFHRMLEGKSENYIENVRRIYEESRKRNIHFILLNQQAWSKLVPRKELRGTTYQEEVKQVKTKLSEKGVLTSKEASMLIHSVLMENLEKFAVDNHVPFVDIIDALNQERDVLVSWVHLSPKGNKMIATTLAREIMELTCPTGTQIAGEEKG